MLGWICKQDLPFVAWKQGSSTKQLSKAIKNATHPKQLENADLSHSILNPIDLACEESAIRRIRPAPTTIARLAGARGGHAVF